MTKEEIQSNNKLIAEFMGAIPNPKSLKTGCTLLVGNNKKPYHYFYADLKYHKSWDWLMPVIEKISKEKFEDGYYCFPMTFGMLHEETGEYMFRFNRFFLHQSEKLIDAAYNAVIEVIKSLNKNK